MDEELKRRIDEYADSFTAVTLRAKLRARRMAQQLSKEVGEEIIMPPHVRALAYLIGFEDNTPEHNPFNVSLTAYRRKILPAISATGVINPTIYNPRLGRKGYLEVAFKRSAVEDAFRTLHDKGLAEYSKERFAEALQYVK